MSAPTPSIREQGVQALREGNLDKAIDLLARAVMADDSDAEAKALLGVVYSQKGIHAQAARALRTAVELQPQNPNFRYNLGVVLERSGDMAGAAAAFRDTLALNKDHAQARAKLQAIPNAHQLLANAPPSAAGGAVPPPPAAAPHAPGGGPPAYGAPPGYGAPPAGSPGAPPGYGAPPPGPHAAPPSGPGSPPPGINPMGGPPMGGSPAGGPPPGMHGATPMGGGLNAPQGPPGTVQCPRCSQFSRLGMTCEWCSAPLAPPVRSANADPVMAAGYGQGTAFTGGVGYAAPPEDGFSPVQAARDWWHALTSPGSFFQEQQGREGLAAPISFLLVWVVALMLLVMVPLSVANVMAIGAAAGATGNTGARGAGYLVGMIVGVIIGVICGSVLYWVVLMISMFIWAGIVHLICKMFGGVAGYSGTFRACTYALSPAPLFLLLAGLVLFFVEAPELRATPRRAPSPTLRSYHGQILVAQNFQVRPSAPPGVPGGQFPQANSPFPSRPGGGFPGVGPSAFPLAKPTPITSLIVIVSGIYYMVLMGIGVANIHSLSTGKAVGVAILSTIVNLVISLVIAMAFGLLLVGMLAGAMGGMGR